MRKRGSWHLAVGWQAGAGGTVFSPAALKVVDVVQTLSAGGSESRPPWPRLPVEAPKRAHVVRQRGRVSAQESRRHMCTAAFRKGCWAQAQAKWTRGTRASQPCRAARRGATQRPGASQHATGEIALSRALVLTISFARAISLEILFYLLRQREGVVSVSFFLHCCSRDEPSLQTMNLSRS